MTDHARELATHFQQLGLPEDASMWLLDMWHVIQTFDDIADGDPVTRRDLDLTIWKALIAMPANTLCRRIATGGGDCVFQMESIRRCGARWTG